MKVLISGAGIGGLAAARALIADGHQVTVFEQAGELRHGGAAVTLWSNGTGVLSALDVAVDGAGGPIDALETRDRRGKLLVTTDVARAAAHYGYPQICLPRDRLLGLLAAGLPEGTIVFGRAAASAVSEDNGVRLTLADGGSAEGDVLVAADGRGSALRDQIWGGDPGELTGWATWQGVSPVPVDITSSRRAVMFVGRPGSVGLMPAGDGLLQWWFDLRWTPGSSPAGGPVAMLREQFAGWAPPVQHVLAAVTDAETGFFPHYRHRVPRTWGSGRITVIGDAAHVMPPIRSQGANQALEDGWALAAALRGDLTAKADGAGAAPEPSTSLRAFERSRSAKAAIVSKAAGTEDLNRHGALMTQLARGLPSSLTAAYYTRWLGRISTYLDAAGAGALASE